MKKPLRRTLATVAATSLLGLSGMAATAPAAQAQSKICSSVKHQAEYLRHRLNDARSQQDFWYWHFALKNAQSKARHYGCGAV